MQGMKKNGGIDLESNGLDIIWKLMKQADTDSTVFPPTELYNEGWMLRILLAIQAEGKGCFPFSFHQRARWFSEAELNSPFLRRWSSTKNRPKDPLAEGHTHTDGAIGHFEFRLDTKTGFSLTADSMQFIVVEAKMEKPLSPGVTNEPDYDQAARTVACMAWTIYESNRPVDDLESLGFYVIAPEDRIRKGIFEAEMRKSSIEEKVKNRKNRYRKDEVKYQELQKWFEDFFIPTLERIDIECISWKETINRIGNRSIWSFYEQCREFNKSAHKRRREKA